LLLAVVAVLVGVGVSVSVASGGAVSGQSRWVAHDLGTLGRSFITSSAVDINENGQIVGGSGTGSLGRAFIWESGKMTPLGTLGGLESAASAINDQGQVIGGSLTRKPAKGHSFLWQNGKMIDLAPLAAIAINNHGQIVGNTRTASGVTHAALWTDGKLRDLGTLGGRNSNAVAINDHGQIVGSSDSKANDKNGQPISHAFLWQNGKMRDLGTLGSGYVQCYPVDINEHGQVVGSCDNPAISYGQCGGGQHAFLWQNGKMRDLGTLGRKSLTSTAVASNDRGWIIGNSPATCEAHGFLWRNGTMIDLRCTAGAINERGQVLCGSSGASFVWENGKRTKLPTLPPHIAWTGAAAINEHDQIVGSSSVSPSRAHAVLWTLASGT
jgi:probable HAF family extracellular repeat protein